MSWRPARTTVGLRVLAVWLVGTVVIGLVLAHRAAGSASAVPAAAASAAAADPVGKVEAVTASARVPAAALAGLLLGGGSYDAAAHAGHITVVTAWGSWCEPCKRELPALRRLALASYASAVDFVGLDEEEASMAAGLAMVRRYGLPYRSIYDQDRTIYSALAPLIAASGVPGTVVIDSHGRVAATVIGAVNEAQLASYLRALAQSG